MLKFGEALVKEGIVTQDQLKQVLERQVIFGGRIGTNLVEMGFVTENDLTRLLSKYLRIKSVDTKELIDIPEEVIQCISSEIADHYKIIPFKQEKKRLHVAMVDVRNFALVDELRFKTGYDIIPYIVSEIRLLFALEKYYGIKRDLRYISVFDGFEEEGGKDRDDSKELKRVKNEFLNVKERGEVAAILLNESKRVAARSVLFIIKEGMLKGWASKTINIDGFSANIESRSTVSEVLAKKSYYRGPVIDIPGNQELIKLFGGVPQDALFLPIVIGDRVVSILYADNGIGSVLSSNLNYLEKLTSLAALSFEMLIVRQRIIDL
jgi:competence protein ComGF